MKITLVSTVFNEANRLRETIADLNNQTVQPSEIIITDAGSTDGTYELLQEWKESSTTPILILQKIRCNVAEGRNIAIRAANHPLIVSMDFGCRFKPKWLENLTSPFETGDCIQVVGGGHTVDEAKQVTLAAKADYVANDGYKTNYEIGVFIPSSRSIAYKKSVFDKVGGYGVWLTLAGDDMVFAKEIIANGYQIFVSSHEDVYWTRHTSLDGFMKEAFRYGLGNGEAHLFARDYQLFVTQLFCRIFFFIGLLGLILNLTNSFILIAAVVVSSIGYRPYFSYFKKWWKFCSKKFSISVLLYGFYFYEMTKLSYIRGYTKGFYFLKESQKKQALDLSTRLSSETLRTKNEK